MKIEIPVAYDIDRIVNAAADVAQSAVESHIQGTQTWKEVVLDSWLEYIQGNKNHSNKLVTPGLTLVFEDPQLIFTSSIRDVSQVVREPRILIDIRRAHLNTYQLISLLNVLQSSAENHHLRQELEPTSIVFPKEVYATNVVVFDARELLPKLAETSGD